MRRDAEAPDIVGPVGGPAELARLVRETVASGALREALCLRLSRLPPGLRRQPHRRLLGEAIAPLRDSPRLRLFELPNRDLVAIAPPPARDLVEAETALGALLGEAGSGVVTTLRLPGAAAALLALVEDGLAGPDPVAPAEGETALTPELLGGFERALAQADLAPFQRERTVCRIEPDGPAPRPVWSERRVALAELRDRLLPGSAPDTDPALARRLRRLVDRRVLADLARAESAARLGPLAVPLALASLTGPEFLRLDAALPSRARRGLVLGLDPADLLADPGAAAFAAAFAEARGYRLALEVTDPEALGALAPRPFGIALLRIAFTPGLPRAARPLRALIEAGTEVVLAEANRPAAIAWGWESGIRLFQGRLVERGLHG